MAKAPNGPLSRKFGCVPQMAVDVLVYAHQLGLESFGVSFHVGSQMTKVDAWDAALSDAKRVFVSLAKLGIELKMVNMGGGFPTKYLKDISVGRTAYGQAIFASLSKHFGKPDPDDHHRAGPRAWLAMRARSRRKSS